MGSAIVYARYPTRHLVGKVAVVTSRRVNYAGAVAHRGRYRPAIAEALNRKAARAASQVPRLKSGEENSFADRKAAKRVKKNPSPNGFCGARDNNDSSRPSGIIIL